MMKATNNQFRIYTFLFGLVIGVATTFALGAMSKEKSDSNVILSPGVFGNLKILKAKPSNWQDRGEGLLIANGDCPIVVIGKDKNDKVFKLSILDEEFNALSTAEFEDDKINKVSIFCLKGDGGFIIHRIEDGSWGNAAYLSKRNPAGEYYYDIDFDGQFDCKIASDEKGMLTYSIFKDGRWISAISCSGKKEKATLKTQSGIEDYYFEKGKGWVKQH
jgi:hypothetical protein